MVKEPIRLLEQIEKILQKQKLYLEKLYGYQEAGKDPADPKSRTAFERRIQR